MSNSVTEQQARISALLGHDKPESLEDIWHSQMRKCLDSAIHDGHFRLGQNKHSRMYIKFDRAFFFSDQGKAAAAFLAGHLSNLEIIDRGIDAVVGPETGGALLAQTLSEVLSVAPHYGVRKTRDFEYELEDEVAAAVRGKNVLVVDDVLDSGITMGGSVIPALKLAGASIVGAAFLADRGRKSLSLFCPSASLWKAPDAEYYREQDCPMCKAGEPFTVL